MRQRREEAASWPQAFFPALVLLVFFVIPFAIMLAVSFFKRIEGGFFEPSFELSNYIRFLSPFFGKILFTSIALAAGAAAIVVVIAFPFTYIVSRMDRRSQTIILVFILSVLSLSEVIIGFAWSTLLSRTAGIGNLIAWLGLSDAPQAYTPGLVALILGLSYLGFPYAVLTMYPAVSRLDPELPEAARMSGASPLRAFVSVTLPIMRRPITGALILVFVFTLGAYLLPQVLGRPAHWTLPVHITDQAIFQSNIPFGAAMAMFFLLVSLALVGLALAGQRRPQRQSAMTGWLGKAFVAAVLVFLAAPLVVVAGVSVNQPKRLMFPPEGFSLKWYGELFTKSDWAGSLTNSAIIAVLAGLLAVSVALPLALYIWSRGGLLGRVLFGLGIAPFLLPPVISALGFMVFWISAGLYGHILATIVSHAVFLVALPLVTISLGLEGIDRSLIEAARTMGANRRTVFLTVVFPLVRPYVLSGFAFAVVLSLNEYIIAYMVAGFSAETLPIKIFNSLRYGYTPVMASAAVLFVLIAVVVFGAIARFGDLPRLLGAHRSQDA